MRQCNWVKTSVRILHVVHQYSPESVGGTELYTRALARQQAQQGHTVAIFTPAIAAPTEPAMENGVRVYRAAVGERGSTAVFLHTFRHPQLNRAFAAVLQRERPDLVHIQHLMGLPIGLVDQIGQAGLPYVVTLHDYWYLCANAQLLTNYDNTVCAGPDYWLNCARCALARVGHSAAFPLIPAIAPLFSYRQARLHRVLANARALIAPTRFVAQIHAQMGLPVAKIQVVQHGIAVPDDLPPRPPRRPGLRIGYVGGLSWQKGVHVLIAAVNQLPQEGVTLAVMGDTAVFPDYVAQLQRQARHPGITFTGRIPYEQLWAALAALDVVVVPTLWYETASLIVQEAFAAGAPVVASAIGALQERVRDGIDGILVPPGDVNALREALHLLSSEPARLSQLRSGIRPVRTMADHAREINSIYQELA